MGPVRREQARDRVRPGVTTAQPTMSQQIRRLEDLVGAPLLGRRRESVRLTAAGTALLDAYPDVL